ncbi:hypothetical protein Tco_1184485 [Tanacetum coccineum]
MVIRAKVDELVQWCRTRGRSGDQGDGRNDGQGGQVGSQGREVNDGCDESRLSTIIANIAVSRGFVPIRTFLACNPKSMIVRDGAYIVIPLDWRKDGCQLRIEYVLGIYKVKYTAGSFVGKALT